jgi:hypothetical protein
MTCYIVSGIHVLMCILCIALIIILITTSQSESDNYDYYRSRRAKRRGGGAGASVDYLLEGVGVFFWIIWMLAMFISVYLFFARCRTRMIMRQKYGIRDSCCGDCCAASCCCLSSCVVSQMARHTNDYEVYPVLCCSADNFSRTGQSARTKDQVSLAIKKVRSRGAPKKGATASGVTRTSQNPLAHAGEDSV